MCLTMHRGIFLPSVCYFPSEFILYIYVECVYMLSLYLQTFKLICNTYKCANIVACIAICNYRTISTGAGLRAVV